jgi:hypothetical protein
MVNAHVRQQGYQPFTFDSMTTFGIPRLPIAKVANLKRLSSFTLFRVRTRVNSRSSLSTA